MDNMAKADDFFCVNIKEYLVPDSEDGVGEEELRRILSDFHVQRM